MRRCIIVFIFGLFSSSAHAQVGNEAIYIGVVKGMKASDFAKSKSNLANCFKLDNLNESKNEIEIRLYETHYSEGLIYCTVLSFDKLFKLRRTYQICFFDSAKCRLQATNFSDDKNPAEVFKTLISNGIFSLTSKSYKEIFKEGSPKELTEKGLEDTESLVVADGVGYTLEYKVYNTFSRIQFANPEIYLEAYPDNQTFRRQKEIAEVLGTGLK